MGFVADSVALGQVFSPRTCLGLPCRYHSTNPPYSPSFSCSSYQEGKKGAKPGNLPKINDMTEMGEIWVEEYCHFVLEELV